MSDPTHITSDEGDDISAFVSDDGKCVVIGIREAGQGADTAMIWLSPEKADEFVRMIAAARVEISKAKPKS